MTEYLTHDGYRLQLVDGEWTNGDLQFAVGRDGAPVNDDGDRVDGMFIHSVAEYELGEVAK